MTPGERDSGRLERGIISKETEAPEVPDGMCLRCLRYLKGDEGYEEFKVSDGSEAPDGM